jgi:methylglutaconyl-CoA hydratase
LDKRTTIKLNKYGSVAIISLNRPELRNAMNLPLVRELSTTLETLNSDKTIRLLIINSRGENFCSGADLTWMQDSLKLSEDQLKSESLELAKLFRILWGSVAVTICSVKGLIPGGAIGLLAASDFVVAESSTVLTFSEVNLGLIPATIAPYVLRKAGFGRASDWMMTGRLIGAVEARDAGLIHRICEEGSLEESTEELAGELLSKGEEAVKGVKRLLRELEDLRDPAEVDSYTSRLIAEFRKSPEGQEGMKAFLEKRKPRWNEGQ